MGSSSELEILYTGVSLLLVILAGWVCAHFKVFPQDRATAVVTKYTFLLGIPALVFQGLATKDFPELEWRFVAVFLVLRVVFGALTFVYAFFGPKSHRVSGLEDDPIGSWLTDFISSTWINTIILGLPMLQALYGPRVAILNILAAVSSLFFQLPVMLCAFEYRRIRHGLAPAAPARDNDPEAGPVAMKDVEVSASQAAQAADQPAAPATASYGAVLRGLATNPPMIGIIVGLLWSLIITTGFEEDKLPRIISDTAQLLSDPVQPLAAFAIGMHMRHRETWFLRNLGRNMTYIFLKMVVLPAFAIAVVFMLDVDDEDPIQGRSAVLIASLPVAIASFSIGDTYFDRKSVPVVIFSSQLILGTILMVPVFAAWDAIMDSADLFGSVPNGAVYVPS